MESIKSRVRAWYDEYKIPFYITIVLGFIAHGYMITNKLVNHDELLLLFEKGSTYEIGRWGLEITKYIFPNLSMPWLYGIITILLIAISACLITKILNIKSRIAQCLIGGIMVTYPSIICTFGYMYASSSYALAIFLSVLSVYFATKEKRSSVVFSVLCLIFSLGIYQAYLSISATLFVILLIKDCIENKKSCKQILLKGIKFLGILLVSLVIYMLITKLTQKINGVKFTDYQGADQLGNIKIGSIITGIYKAERTILQVMFGNFYGVSTGMMLKIAYTLIVAVTVITVIICIRKIAKNDVKKAILLALFVLILPITMNMMFVVNANTEMHTLIVYANFMIVVLPFVLLESLNEKGYKKYFVNVVYATLAVILYVYITLANESYLQSQLTYENTYAFYNSLVTRIESTEGFNKNTKIAIIGEYSGEKETNLADKFTKLDHFVGTDSNIELINSYSKECFIKYYIGVDFEYVTEEELEKLSNSEEVQKMNIYPYEGSIKNINNVIVIKFSEKV